MKQQRQELEKPDQAAILIMDAFRGQMTRGSCLNASHQQYRVG